MNTPIRYESIQEPLDAEERELMEPDNWDWENPIEGVTVGEPGTLFSLEFTRDDHRLLSRAAYAKGITPHEFIKRSALAAARANQPEAQESAETSRAATG